VKSRQLTVVRIYIREGEHILNELVRFLHDDQKISGLTVLRGVLGFGDSGQLHPASLVDLSLDLPLVTEFFEDPERAQQVIENVIDRFDLVHVVCWPATGWSVEG
jgi:PII-like signaling protein